MRLPMQAAIAHTFALSMAVAVVALPAPKDLLASIGPSGSSPTLTEADSLPDTLEALAAPPDTPDYGPAISPDHARAALTGCASYLDRALNPSIEPCRTVIEQVQTVFAAPTDLGPMPRSYAPGDHLTEAMILANAQLCRTQWRAADGTSGFDLASCISDATALAMSFD